MKIAYITAHAPLGSGETFIINEMLALIEQGLELIIVPRNPPKDVFHAEATQLVKYTLRLPLLNRRILFRLLKTLLSNLQVWWILWTMFSNSRTFKIFLKNLAVLPKAVFISDLFHKKRLDHIHAHWGSTTSTMAWIASELTGIPWSVTLHRWDIFENNLLKIKVERASAARCISENGRIDLLHIVGNEYQSKVSVIHMGVQIPKLKALSEKQATSHFVIACPANLLPVKGHYFLIEACDILVKRGIVNITCLIIGDGPMENTLREQVRNLGLEKIIEFLGRLPQEKLLQMYENGEINVVVLPSIVTDDGEKEGIPVALMEAMAYGIPVISTDIGGIPELLSNGAGIIVKEKNSYEIADAIQKLLRETIFTKEMIEKGHKKIIDEFNIQKNVHKLIKLMLPKSLTE